MLRLSAGCSIFLVIFYFPFEVQIDAFFQFASKLTLSRTTMYLYLRNYTLLGCLLLLWRQFSCTSRHFSSLLEKKPSSLVSYPILPIDGW